MNHLRHLTLKNAPGLSLSGDGAGSISGYASTFGNEDRVGDVIAPGAFTETLPSFLKDGFIAVGHQWGILPVATPTAAKEDERGLWIEADFHTTEDAQAARRIASERLERGKSVGLSIGFEVKRHEVMESGWKILEADLYEVSLVNVPANPQATVMSAKGLLAGLTMADHSDAVLATVREYVERMKGLAEKRAEDGRTLSSANIERLNVLKGELEALITEATRPDPEDVMAQFRAVQLETLRIQGSIAHLGATNQ